VTAPGYLPLSIPFSVPSQFLTVVNISMILFTPVTLQMIDQWNVSIPSSQFNTMFYGNNISSNASGMMTFLPNTSTTSMNFNYYNLNVAA
jgi:hypothetical protein